MKPTETALVTTQMHERAIPSQCTTSLWSRTIEQIISPHVSTLRTRGRALDSRRAASTRLDGAALRFVSSHCQERNDIERTDDFRRFASSSSRCRLRAFARRACERNDFLGSLRAETPSGKLPTSAT